MAYITKQSKSELQAFVNRVEERILKATGGTASLELLVCRQLTNDKQPMLAARMLEKVVEWKYGKATEHHQIDGHIEHTVFDASRLTDEQLAQAERLIESASLGSD